MNKLKVGTEVVVDALPGKEDRQGVVVKAWEAKGLSRTRTIWMYKIKPHPQQRGIRDELDADGMLTSEGTFVHKRR